MTPMRLAWIVGVTLAVGTLIKHTYFDPQPVTWADMKVYYMKYGGMPCAEATRTACGVNLSKCVDGRLYFCLHDVAVEDSK